MHRNGASINAAIYNFDARSGSRGQKIQHGLPVVRRTKVKPEEIVIVRLDFRLSRQPPNLCRRSMIDVANASVESPNAAESRGQRNLIHGQIRFVDQFLGEVQAARLSHGYWSRAQVFQKQAPQVPRSNS